jgi:DNA ligase 1
MLASECTDVAKLRYPVLCSTKLDGVRATVQGGRLVTRSLKDIPNVNVQRLFAGLHENLDGELIVGDPCAADAYRKTVSVVMSDDKPVGDVAYHVFDMFSTRGFAARLTEATANVEALRFSHPVVIVEHIVVSTREELDALEAQWLIDGHEGVMIRALDGPYKNGRSSEREGYLLKLKQFKDSEAVVLGTYEQMHNDNVAKTNALGRTERSTEKAGMVPAGVLGGLHVRDVVSGVEFDIGGGFTAAMRAEMWATRDALVDSVVKYKYFPSGGKDKPRFPVYLGPRDARDK